MEENKLYKSLVICVLLFVSLLLGAILPRFTVAGYEFKNIDIFADLRVKEAQFQLTNTYWQELKSQIKLRQSKRSNRAMK